MCVGFVCVNCTVKWLCNISVTEVCVYVCVCVGGRTIKWLCNISVMEVCVCVNCTVKWLCNISVMEECVWVLYV